MRWVGGFADFPRETASQHTFLHILFWSNFYITVFPTPFPFLFPPTLFSPSLLPCPLPLSPLDGIHESTSFTSSTSSDNQVDPNANSYFNPSHHNSTSSPPADQTDGGQNGFHYQQEMLSASAPGPGPVGIGGGISGGIGEGIGIGGQQPFM